MTKADTGRRPARRGECLILVTSAAKLRDDCTPPEPRTHRGPNLAMPRERRAIHASAAVDSSATPPAERAAAGEDIERQFLALTENLPDFVARVDRELRYTYVNRRLEQLAGIPGRELVGRTVGRASSLQPDAPIEREIERLRHAMRRALATGALVEQEVELPAGGSGRVFNVRIIPERDEPPGRAGLLLIGRDITETRRRDEALRASQRDLIEAQRVAGLGNWRYDQVTSELLWSDELYRIFGFKPQEFAGTFEAFLSRVHADDRDRVWAVSAHARRDGQPFSLEYRVVRPDGEERIIRDIGYAVRNAAGEVAGLFGTAQDITAGKRAEAALRRSELQLQQVRAELARVARAILVGELTASIAHEVNQPLAGVVTNAEACLRWLGGATPNLGEAETALHRIIRDGNRASSVISRIRGLLRNDPPETMPVCPYELVRELAALTEQEFRARGVQWQVNLAPALPHVLADRVQLLQVLLNLVLNSLDALVDVADRAREITVAVEPGAAGTVRFRVADNGVGLTPEELERVFDPFYTTKHEGIGMGLSISRAIIDAHGGKLRAEMPNGPGIAFEFELPAAGRRG